MDALIYNRLQEINACEDEARRQEMMDASNEELARHFMRTPVDYEELAFDLLNQAWADAQAGDIVRDVIEVKTVGLGEPDYIDEDLRGMRAYWQGKGGQILSDILRYERNQMPREEIVAAIDQHQDERRLDFWGPFAKLSSHAQEKMRIVPVQKLVEIIQSVITSTSNAAFFGQFAAATVTAAQIDSVLDAVALKSGGRISLLGTPVAIRKLSHIGLEFGDDVKDELFKTGRIGQYKGYPIVQVENFENFEGSFVLPNDEIWPVGRNAGRLTYYGDQAKVQQLRLPSFWERWETARDAGMLLYGAEKGRIGRIKLT